MTSTLPLKQLSTLTYQTSNSEFSRRANPQGIIANLKVRDLPAGDVLQRGCPGPPLTAAKIKAEERESPQACLLGTSITNEIIGNGGCNQALAQACALCSPLVKVKTRNGDLPTIMIAVLKNAMSWNVVDTSGTILMPELGHPSEGTMQRERQFLLALGLITGLGMGQLIAWLMLRAECSNADYMIVLSTFGVGMTTIGLLRIGYLVLKNR